VHGGSGGWRLPLTFLGSLFVRIGFMRFQSRPVRLMLPLLLSLAAVFSVLLLIMPQAARAQEGALDKSEPKGTTVEAIIKRFAGKEKEFKEARDQYTYRQDVKVMTLDGE